MSAKNGRGELEVQAGMRGLTGINLALNCRFVGFEPEHSTPAMFLSNRHLRALPRQSEPVMTAEMIFYGRAGAVPAFLTF